MRRDPDSQKQTLIFIAIATAIMIAVFVLFDGKGFVPEFKPSAEPVNIVPDDSPLQGEGFEFLPQPEPVMNKAPEKRSFLDRHDHPLVQEFNMEPPKQTKPVPRYALKNPGPGKARIAVIIDDMGMSRGLSKQIIGMKDAPLTLAFLPYAENLSSLTKPALANGHELMIHMPMEPLDGRINTGPVALFDDMSRKEVQAMLKIAFESFDGYGGLNNHMGSRLTQNEEVMGWVMEILAEKGLYYVDSKTIQTSIAADAARAQGLDYATRDVFLDHKDHLPIIRKALAQTEQVALRRGHAIAIGHPRKATVKALKEWLPTLEARGFEIVPVNDLLLTPARDQKLVEAEIKAQTKKKFLPFIEPATGDPISGLYQLPLE